MNYHYEGWAEQQDMGKWPTYRLSTPTPHRCADCGAPATHFVLSGPLYLCRAHVDERRGEYAKAAIEERLARLRRPA